MKDNIFLKPKDDRTYGERWMTKAGYRELKRFERRSQDGSNGTTWGDITKESEEMQIEALKEAYARS